MKGFGDEMSEEDRRRANGEMVRGEGILYDCRLLLLLASWKGFT